MRRYVVLLYMMVLCFGCVDKHNRQAYVAPQTPLATGTMPVGKKVVAPKVVSFDTCPQPQTLTLPNNTAGRPAIFTVNMITYGAEHGMYSLVNTIMRDRDGNFWLGTGGGGVIRYDGKTSVSYTTAQGLASNAIRCVTQDSGGNFWFGSQGGGFTIYDGLSFTTINKNNGLSSNNIRGIINNVGNTTWLATLGGGINIYNGKTFKTITKANGLVSDNLTGIVRASDGAIWCSADSGVSRVTEFGATGAKGQVRNFTHADGLPDCRVFCLAIDRRNNIWLGTEGGGLCLLAKVDTGSGYALKIYTTETGMPSNNIRGIFEDSRGKMWFCTAGGGVACYDPAVGGYTVPDRLDKEPGAFTVYTTVHGLCSNRVECAGEDATGNLWFGTDGGGVSRFDGDHLKVRVEPKFMVKNSVNCVRPDRDGNIWLSSSEIGVTCFDGKGFCDYSQTNVLGDGDNVLLCVLQDSKGNYWLGTSGKGLIKCDQKPGNGKAAHFTFYNAQQGLGAGRVYTIVEDTAGRIWAATNSGISCYNGTSFTTYTTAQGLGANATWCALRSKNGDMWFGTFGGGVSRFVPHPADGGYARFVTYTTADGLASNSVKCITEDSSGNIWIGTGGGGINRYDGKMFVNYTTLDGLANNIAVATGVDKWGNVWFGTNEGLSVIKGYRPNEIAADDASGKLITASNGLTNSQLTNGYKPVFEQYNYKGGFPIKDINTNALLIDTAGIVWAGTADKLINFNYRKLDKRVEVPHVFIDGLRIGGEKISWHTLKNQQQLNRSTTLIGIYDSLAMVNEELLTFDNVASQAQRDSMLSRFGTITFDSIMRFYAVPMGLVLPYKHNNITIDFAATELTRPFLVRYQYMLEGYDKGWGPVTERTSVSYGNIPEGYYTFKLRAQSPDGVWSHPVSYSFKVLPPVYRTWWAYLLYIGTLVGVVYMVVHVRTGILKRENARLEAIVAERTAQIETEKAAVLKQAEELKKLNAFKDKTFSVLSHDLRGPIATSAMVVSLLDEVTQEEFKVMKEGVVHQLEATSLLLDNLLRWAKSSMEGTIKVNREWVQVAAIVDRNADLFSENLRMKHIAFVQKVAPGLELTCDAEHLDIVVRNLLANAIKFTPVSGTIELSAVVKGADMHLSISDTGVGMTKAQQEHLFKPVAGNTTFGTEGEKGTGLGLVLCYEFIKANNGSIQLHSEEGKGTTFTVILPV